MGLIFKLNIKKIFNIKNNLKDKFIKYFCIKILKWKEFKLYKVKRKKNALLIEVLLIN